MTEIQKTESNAVANIYDEMEGESTLDASDIQIPRLHLLQGQSDGVVDGDLSMGDIIHTGTQEVLGKSGDPVEIIPFHIAKVSQKFRSDVSPKEYITTEAFKNQPWEEDYMWEQRDGNVIKCKVNNYKTFIVHAIVVGDDSGMGLPVTITFKSTAGKDGQKIASHFATVMQFNHVKKNLKGYTPEPTFNVSWLLESDSIKQGRQAYAVWKCKKSRKTTTEEREECATWASAIAANSAKYTKQAVAEEQGKVEEVTMKSAPKRVEPMTTDDVPF